MAKENGRKLIASNKKARHDYAILKTYEAGLVLAGTEVKSLREGRASLVDAFAQEHEGEIMLYGLHIAEYGFGSPDVVILMYLVKMLVFVAIGWAFIMTTPGIDGWFDPGSWWRAPEAFYKFALWTMLFEVLGLGCGFGPLNLRFIPPMGSPLYWLRPGTIRLPPFRGRVPLTGGDTRTIVDVVLYAGLLVSIVVALVGALPRWEVRLGAGGLWPPRPRSTVRAPSVKSSCPSITTVSSPVRPEAITARSSTLRATTIGRARATLFSITKT